MGGFGERLRKLRKEKNFSQETLAGLVNVHNNTVSKWENGVIPHMKKITELAKVLGTTSTYLLGEDAESSDKENLPAYLTPTIVQLTSSIDDPTFVEKLIQSKSMVVYEQGNVRMFIPATTEGFNFIRDMRTSNNASAVPAAVAQ